MEIRSKVESILISILGDEFKNVSSASRNDMPTWDSMKHLDIVFALEEEFNVSIDPEDFSKFDSLDNITAYLREGYGS